MAVSAIDVRGRNRAAAGGLDPEAWRELKDVACQDDLKLALYYPRSNRPRT
jgi:hypothetical protein